MTRSHLLTRNKQLEKAMKLSIKWRGDENRTSQHCPCPITSASEDDRDDRLPYTRKTLKIGHYFSRVGYNFLDVGRK